MDKQTAINAILSRRIPKGSVAVVANVTAAYVSELCTGKHVPHAATEKIIDATADIVAFVDHFSETQGIVPDLRNGEQLRSWIERWKQSPKETVSA
jgi:hypothetical protein